MKKLIEPFKADLKISLGNFRAICLWTAAGIFAIYLLSGVYVVDTNETGTVKRFGAVTAENVSPGIHYCLPCPIDSVDKVEIKEIKRLEVGFFEGNNYCLTGDKNIMHTKMVIQYSIKGPKDFLYNINQPEMLLLEIASSSILSSIARMFVDDVLTIGKHKLEQSVLRDAQTKLDSVRSGIQLVSVELKSADPPKEAISAFKDVINAQEDKSTAIHEAQSYENRIIPEAKAEASTMIQQARSYKAEKTHMAQGEANRFLQILAKYSKAKEITRERLYIETMEEVLSKVKKYIISQDEGEDIATLRFFSR